MRHFCKNGSFLIPVENSIHQQKLAGYCLSLLGILRQKEFLNFTKLSLASVDTGNFKMTFKISAIVFKFVTCILVHGHIQFHNMSRKQLVDYLLDSARYNPRIPPDFDKDVPTNVSLQIHIINLHSIDEVSMAYSMTLYLRRKWTDQRLAFPSFPSAEMLELDTSLMDKIWIPDIYFRNEKSASTHIITLPNRLINLHKNGTVLISSRLSMTLSCHMNFALFPLDIQTCPLILQSYAYSVSNVYFRWTKTSDKITKTEELETIHDWESDTRECTDVFDNQFACVMATFRIQRHVGYFLVNVYLPSTLVLILSWVSFWIDANVTPARITLTVMSVLTIVTQSSGIVGILPKVSYIKAIDVWMAACMFFVFAALLEFAYVNYLSRRHPLQTALRSNKGRTRTDTIVRLSTHGTGTCRCLEPHDVDKMSRWAFPGCFFVFVFVYWAVYGTLAAHQTTATVG